MFTSKQSRIVALASIALLIFTLWFADGYMQWVNSDTAGEAYGTSQYFGFPQALRSTQHMHRSRITATILSYLPFHAVGIVYRELKDDPVNALYVSQGFLTGVILLLFLFVSAAYISSPAPMLSGCYLSSSVLLLLLSMSIPAEVYINKPLTLALRFHHQAILSNYVGTLAIALLVLLPYWRYLFSREWGDWYGDLKWRSVFYMLVIGAVFSSTATMTWLWTIAVTVLTFFLVSSRRQNQQVPLRTFLSGFVKDSRTHPLFLIIALTIIAVMAEATGKRGVSTVVRPDLVEYLKAYLSFLTTKEAMYYGAICLLLIGLIISEHGKGTASSQMVLLAKFFPCLLVGNLIYLFLIGMPRVPYRFGGHNLGADTALPATWSTLLWIMTVTIAFWRERKLTWIAPLLLFLLATNALRYFTFPAYELRESQKTIFSRLHHEDKTLPRDVLLPIPVDNVAFDVGALKHYTIPMLREMQIISSQRKLLVVTKDVYESWQAVLAKDGAPPPLSE